MTSVLAFPRLYVSTNSCSSPTGSEDCPFPDLTSALTSTDAPQLSVEMLGTAQTYGLQALSNQEELTLNCTHNTLLVMHTLLVFAGHILHIQNCHIRSNVTTGAVFVTFGAVTVIHGSVENLKTKGFLLYGALHISDVQFLDNQDSILVAQNFGFNLTLESCWVQGNSSPVGAVLLLSLATSQPDSSTAVAVNNCTVVGNVAYLGGSFLYLRVSPNIEFLEQQLDQSRSLIVKNSRFDQNPGYLCILTPKYLNLTFTANDYTNHNYGFVISLLGSALMIANSTVLSVNRFVVVTSVVGFIQLHGLNISEVTEGPAILLLNSADQSQGYCEISQVQVQNFTLTNRALFSGTLFAINVRISVSELSAADGDTYGCALGCYFFTAAVVKKVQMRNVLTNSGATVAFIAGYGQVWDLHMSNSTVSQAGYSGLFLSVVSFYNMTFAPGLGSYQNRKEAAANMIASFDSSVQVRGGYYDLPPAKSFVAFYLWRSHGDIADVTFTNMHSNLVDVYLGSCTLRRAVIHSGNLEFLTFLSFSSSLTVEDVTLTHATLIALFSTLSNSSITAARFTMENVTFQSLGIASKSQLDLTDMTLAHIYADALFWYCSASQILANNLTVTDSTFDLVQLFSGVLTLRHSQFERISVRRRFITAQKATIIFDNVHFAGLKATSVIPFALLAHNSTLSLQSSHLSALHSREQDLILVRDSVLVVDSSEISDFNVTFSKVMRSEVLIIGSVIREGGLLHMDASSKAKVTAGLVDAFDSQITVRESHLTQLSGTEGGVFALQNSQITLQDSTFQSCLASKDGGVVYALHSNVTILTVNFYGNQASRGGCVYFECSDASLCSSHFSDSVFLRNTATEGAGVKWTRTRPDFSNITSSGNEAVYGDFEASLATHMTLQGNESEMKGVPGVLVVEPILIVFLDVVGQVVSTDNSSVAVINSTQVLGTNLVVARNGVANFSGVIVQTSPGTTVSLQVISPTTQTSASYVFDYHTRDCIAGEVSSDTGCYLCPKNTFSVDPLERECRECPSYATCPGGAQLVLDSGYWRISNHTAEVYKCPIPSACLGGLKAQCQQNYRDRLCSRCETGFYMAGLTYCVECEVVPIRFFRLGLFVVFLVLLYLYVIRKSASAEVSFRTHMVLPTVRILLNFLQSILMISLIAVDWREVVMGLFSANEMFVSLAATALTLECFECNLYTDEGLSPVVLKALVASLLPVLLVVLNFTVFLCVKRSRKAVLSCFQASLVLLVSLHPYLVKAAVALISCRAIETQTLWLIADVSVQCWTSQHLYFVLGVFVPMFVLYILGIPMVLLVAVSKLRSGSAGALVMFFTLGYRRGAGTWEVAVVLRKMLLFLLLGLLGGSEALIQILTAMVALYLFLEWHIRTAPFESAFHNKLEGVSLFLQLVVTGFSFYFIPKQRIRDIVLSVISYAVLLLVLTFIVSGVVLTFAQVVVYRRQRTLKVTSRSVDAVLPVPPPSHNSSVLNLVPRAEEVSREKSSAVYE